MTTERLAEIERHLTAGNLVREDLKDCVSYIYRLLAIIAKQNSETTEQFVPETKPFLW